MHKKVQHRFVERTTRSNDSPRGERLKQFMYSRISIHSYHYHTGGSSSSSAVNVFEDMDEDNVNKNEGSNFDDQFLLYFD